MMLPAQPAVLNRCLRRRISCHSMRNIARTPVVPSGAHLPVQRTRYHPRRGSSPMRNARGPDRALGATA